MSEPVETGQGEGVEVLYDEMYGEILARIRNPDQYAEQPHRYRAVWQAVAVTSYVAALVAQEYERGRADGVAEERAKWKWLEDARTRLAGKYTYAPGPGGNLDRIARLSAEDMQPAVEEWIKSHYRALDAARGIPS